MNPEDIERRLSEAFNDRAFRAVSEQVAPPPLQLDRPAPRRHRVVRILAPLTAAAAVAAVAVGIAVHQGTNRPGRISAGQSSIPAPSSPVTTPTMIPATQLVHLAFKQSDGEQTGVGMPVIANLSKAITDGRGLQAATRVTVDGKPVAADWYFAPGTGSDAAKMQGHLRMSGYWPAHAQIVVKVAAKGVSAGKGLTFDDNISLTFTTGPAVIATVDDSTHTMTVLEDGKPLGKFPVSLGAVNTPTSHGVKVIMAKGANICLTGPGYHECNLKYTQQLTSSGEYLVAAPWNVKHIEQGIDSSNGCTNLTTADAARLYSIFEIGDVVNYPNASGGHMNFDDGYGDWNVPWSQWLTGGLVPTH